MWFEPKGRVAQLEGELADLQQLRFVVNKISGMQRLSTSGRAERQVLSLNASAASLTCL